MTDAVDQATLELIGDGLNRFNDDVTGYGDRVPLGVLVRDPASGEVVGGAVGRSSLGLLFLDLFFLPAELRGSGMGSEVLARFEAEGRRRGCRSAVVYTLSVQAPGFYRRCGWRRFEEFACDPPGSSRVFLTKAL